MWYGTAPLTHPSNKTGIFFDVNDLPVSSPDDEDMPRGPATGSRPLAGRMPSETRKRLRGIDVFVFYDSHGGVPSHIAPRWSMRDSQLPLKPERPWKKPISPDKYTPSHPQLFRVEFASSAAGTENESFSSRLVAVKVSPG